MNPSKQRLIWSKKEVEFLMQNYKTMEYSKISSLLNRTETSIYAKMSALGLNKYNKLTNEDKIWINSNYLNFKIKEIAEILNKNENTIQSYLIKHNLNKQKKNYINIPIEEIDKKIKSGMNLTDIANEYGVNNRSLVRYCLKHNYDIVENYPEKIKRRKKDKSAKNSLYLDYKSRANRKNLEFTLSFQEFDEITSSNCYYCDETPKNKKYANGDKKVFCFYNGVDRFNNGEGYTKNNSLPCCGECNKMKLDLSFNDFLNKIQKILNKFRK
jgi:hypothetical protein